MHLLSATSVPFLPGRPAVSTSDPAAPSSAATSIPTPPRRPSLRLAALRSAAPRTLSRLAQLHRRATPIAALPLLAAALCLLLLGAAPLAAATRTFTLSTATIPDIHAAVDAGALTYEKLTQLYLARIAAYDQQGPALNTVIALNPRALEEARALDAEFKSKGRRSALHGIPILAKDNFDTADIPTTGGAFYLEGAKPPRDGHNIRALRAAGALILAKVNLDELAGGGIGFSSLWGQTKNPHALDRIPAGSSGATGAGLAAWFAPLGLGTDTGGSIRGPCSANGIPGIKPTNGLLSRAGIIPRVLSLDTGGPMARSVYDVALALGFMTGVDPDDPLTEKSTGLYYTDYTRFLDKDALRGARLGIVRVGLGADPEVDKVFDAAVADLRRLGATIIDPVTYPTVVLEGRAGVTEIIRQADIREELGKYLATLPPGYPKSLDEMIARHDALEGTKGRVSPNKRLYAALKASNTGLKSTDALYRSAKEHGMAMIRDAVLSTFTDHQLDAIVYCTRGEPPALIADSSPDVVVPNPPRGFTNIANVTQFPDVIVPAGFSHGTLPVSISFFGPAFSEPRLLAYAYAYEQATKKLAPPATTPALPGETFTF